MDIVEKEEYILRQQEIDDAVSNALKATAAWLEKTWTDGYYSIVLEGIEVLKRGELPE